MKITRRVFLQSGPVGLVTILTSKTAAAGVPPPPRGLVVADEDRRDTSLKVKWSAQDASSFEVLVRDSEDRELSFQTAGTELLIEALTPNETYSLVVRATNAEGWSPASASMMVATRPRRPSTPQVGAASLVNPAAGMVVAWDISTFDGKDIGNWKIEVSRNAFEANPSMIATGLPLSGSLVDSASQGIYRLRVSVVNSAVIGGTNISEWSDPVRGTVEVFGTLVVPEPLNVTTGPVPFLSSYFGSNWP